MEIATAFVAVRPSAAGFGPALDAQLQPQLVATEGRISRLFTQGGAFASAAKGFAAGIVGSQAIDALMGTADAASNLNEEISKSRIVFGESADEILEWSETGAAALQLSQRAALQTVGVYGDFFNTLNLGSDVAARLGEQLVQRAADVASFKNAAGGAEDVSSRFFRALTGERESLKDLGIVITEIDVANKAASMGFERQAGQFSQGAKALATYELILEKTASAQGDVARTGGEFAGQQREAGANVEDLSAAVGDLLVPGLRELYSAFNDLAGPVGAFIDLLDSLEVGGKNIIGALNPLNLVTGPVQGLATGLGFVTDTLGLTGDEIAETETKSNSLVGSLGGLGGGFSALRDRVNEAGEAANDFQADIDNVADAFFGSMDAEEDYADALRNVDEAQAGVARSQRDLSDARAGVADAERELAEAVRDQADAQEEAALAVERADRALQSAERNARRAARNRAEALEEEAEARRIHEHNLENFGPGSHRTEESAEKLDDASARAEDAQFALEEAEQRVADAARAQRDAHEELASALDGTDAASQRVRDAQERVRDAHERVSEAADGVADAQRRVAEAQDDAARAAIEAEVALRAQNEALAANPEAAAGYLAFLDEVIAKRPDVADTLREWRREFELLGGAVGAVSGIDLTQEGTVGALLWGLASGQWQGSQPQQGGVGDLLGGLFGSAAASPAEDGKALAPLGAKSAREVNINVNGVPDLHTRALMRSEIEDAVGHVGDRLDELTGVRG